MSSITKTERNHKTLTSKHIASDLSKNNSQISPVHDYMLLRKTIVHPEDLSILVKSSCNFKLEIEESILIKLLKSVLNKNIIYSVPLYLF